MPTRRATTSESDATRERLLEVTLRLLNEQGDHALRLADVAREAGVAVSTIYAHFRDRTDLVAAARLIQFEAHARQAIDVAAGALDPSLGREAFVEAAMWPTLLDPTDPDARTRRWDRLEAIADSRHLPDLAARLGELQAGLSAQVAELIRRGQELDLIDNELDPAAIALLSQAMRLGLALWDISGDARPDVEAWNQVVSRVFAAVLPPASNATEAVRPTLTEPSVDGA